MGEGSAYREVAGTGCIRARASPRWRVPPQTFGRAQEEAQAGWQGSMAAFQLGWVRIVFRQA